MNRPAWANASPASRRNCPNKWKRRLSDAYSSSRASTPCSRALCERLRLRPARSPAPAVASRVNAELSARPDESVELDETQVSAGAGSARSSLLLLWTSRS
jgi:hypothetical protein